MSAENNLNRAPLAGLVRLHFTGQNVGSLDYTHPQSGVNYQGGKNTRDEYQDVPKSDVAWLVSTGRFEVVEMPADATETVDERASRESKAQKSALAEQKRQADEAQKLADDAAKAQTAQTVAQDVTAQQASNKPGK